MTGKDEQGVTPDIMGWMLENDDFEVESKAIDAAERLLKKRNPQLKAPRLFSKWEVDKSTLEARPKAPQLSDVVKKNVRLKDFSKVHLRPEEAASVLRLYRGAESVSTANDVRERHFQVWEPEHKRWNPFNPIPALLKRHQTSDLHTAYKMEAERRNRTNALTELRNTYIPDYDRKLLNLSLALGDLTVTAVSIPFEGIRAAEIPFATSKEVFLKGGSKRLPGLGKSPSQLENSGPVHFRLSSHLPDDLKAEAQHFVRLHNRELYKGNVIRRVSTKGMSKESAAARKAEKLAGFNRGTPYKGDVGHVIDTTWSGKADTGEWMDQTPHINRSIGAQSGKYPLNYRSTGFTLEFDDNIPLSESVLKWSAMY